MRECIGSRRTLRKAVMSKSKPKKRRITVRRTVERGEDTIEQAAVADTSKLEQWELELLDRLQFLKDYQSVTVQQFRQASRLGTDARRVLDSYAEQELVKRKFVDATGRYLLTEKGEARLAELVASRGA